MSDKQIETLKRHIANAGLLLRTVIRKKCNTPEDEMYFITKANEQIEAMERLIFLKEIRK